MPVVRACAIALAALALQGEWVGVLLWPAAALHAVLTALLVRAQRRGSTLANSGRSDSREPG